MRRYAPVLLGLALWLSGCDEAADASDDSRDAGSAKPGQSEAGVDAAASGEDASALDANPADAARDEDGGDEDRRDADADAQADGGPQADPDASANEEDADVDDAGDDPDASEQDADVGDADVAPEASLGTQPCGQTATTAGCDDAVVERCVCEHVDDGAGAPCCEPAAADDPSKMGWSQACVDIALLEGCRSCCEAHGGAGCNDTAIQDCVCARPGFEYCCMTSGEGWDGFCVAAARSAAAEGGCGLACE